MPPTCRVARSRSKASSGKRVSPTGCSGRCSSRTRRWGASSPTRAYARSEEHTSELQSQSNLVCRLLLEKKKKDEPDTSQENISNLQSQPNHAPHCLLQPNMHAHNTEQAPKTCVTTHHTYGVTS